MQPSPPNPDHEPSGVQQDISDGSSNHGSMQGSDAGRDSNQISGDGNRISQSQNTQNFFITLDQPQPRLNPRKHHLWIGSSLAIVSLISGTTLISLNWLGIGKSNLTSCNSSIPDPKSKQLKIAIANVVRSDSSIDETLELRLMQILSKQPNLLVCRIEKEVSKDPRLARKYGEDLNAALVIWAYKSSPKSYFGGVEAIKKNVLTKDFTAHSSESSSVNLETEDLPNLITFLTHFTLSQIAYFNGNKDEARINLREALNNARQQGIAAQNQRNKNTLANAYLFFGTLLNDPHKPGCESKPDCEEAVKVYQSAFELSNGNSSVSLFNMAKNYEDLKNFKEARKTYGQIINSNIASRDLVVAALINRAFLSKNEYKKEEAQADFQKAIELNPKEGHLQRAEANLSWKNYPGAINDLKAVIAQDGTNPSYYHFLGMVQLQGKYPESRETYKKMLCHLSDQAMRDKVQIDLKGLANRDPSLTEVIETIIKDMEEILFTQYQKC